MKKTMFKQILSKAGLISFLPGSLLYIGFCYVVQYNVFDYQSAINNANTILNLVFTYDIAVLSYIATLFALFFAIRPITRKIKEYMGDYYELYVRYIKYSILYIFLSLFLIMCMLIGINNKIIWALMLIFFVDSLIINMIAIIIVLNLTINK